MHQGCRCAWQQNCVVPLSLVGMIPPRTTLVSGGRKTVMCSWRGSERGDERCSLRMVDRMAECERYEG